MDCGMVLQRSPSGRTLRRSSITSGRSTPSQVICPSSRRSKRVSSPQPRSTTSPPGLLARKSRAKISNWRVRIVVTNTSDPAHAHQEIGSAVQGVIHFHSARVVQDGIRSDRFDGTACQRHEQGTGNALQVCRLPFFPSLSPLRKESAGALHVGFVLITKCFDHHLLLFRDAQDANR